MGRVKTSMIKKAARELFESVEGFNTDFNHNKKLLKGTMPSKLVQNKVAGGIVRLATQQQQKEHDRGKDKQPEQEE